jgi:beta-glucosidase
MRTSSLAWAAVLFAVACTSGGGGTTGAAGAGGPGSAGTTGAAGAQGSAGTTGAAGDGATGTAGDGATGTAGDSASGTAGTTGSAGTTGAAGRGGATGAAGTTATCSTTGAGGTAPPACTSNPSDYQYPFQDPCRAIEDRITNLLSLLTVQEKVGLMNEYQLPVSRLGIAAYTTFVEGVHGIGWSGDNNTSATASSTTVLYLTGTQFPQAYGLAESWDPESLRTVGATTGYEARVWNAARPPNAQGRGVGLVVRAPLVDLGRDPRWGRTEEGYGEDPFLTAALANGYIGGLHGTDPVYLQAASTLKHWLGNNNETNRNTSSSNIDDRNLREYYGYPFEQTIRIGHAQGMMEAYNKINGTSGAVSPLLKSLVIGEWGMDGTLCTDAWGPQVLVQDQMVFSSLPAAMAGIVKAGTGLILQDTTDARPALMTAATGGMLTTADIDAASRANLRVRFRLGDFDPPARVPYKKILGTETPWTGTTNKQRALDVTRKTVVLLKNASNTLPLAKTGFSNIAVIGPRGDSVLRDWYGGLAPYKITGRQGIGTKLGSGVTINYALDNNGNAANAASMTAAAAGGPTIVFVGNHPTCGAAPPEPNPVAWATCPTTYDGREAVDRKNIALDPTQVSLAQSVAALNPKTIVVLVSSFPQAVTALDSDPNVKAIIHITNSSQELGTAIADVLFGDYNPGGRTVSTWYKTETDIPTTILDYDIKKGTTYWYFGGTPLYPFGHGLSYTTFAYSNMTLSAASVSLAGCGTTTVGIDVRNSGTRAGDEVVQLYVAYPASTTLPRPKKQLRGFKRITLAAGAMEHVTFDLPASALTYWDATARRFTVTPGTVTVQIGASSADTRATMPLTVAQ